MDRRDSWLLNRNVELYQPRANQPQMAADVKSPAARMVTPGQSLPEQCYSAYSLSLRVANTPTCLRSIGSRSDSSGERGADGKIDPNKGSAIDGERTNDSDRNKESNQAIFNDDGTEFVSDETCQHSFHRTSSPCVPLGYALQHKGELLASWKAV
jgi:hypothetical protein